MKHITFYNKAVLTPMCDIISVTTNVSSGALKSLEGPIGKGETEKVCNLIYCNAHLDLINAFCDGVLNMILLFDDLV